jgi:hypothetical protein
VTWPGVLIALVSVMSVATGVIIWVVLRRQLKDTDGSKKESTGHVPQEPIMEPRTQSAASEASAVVSEKVPSQSDTLRPQRVTVITVSVANEKLTLKTFEGPAEALPTVLSKLAPAEVFPSSKGGSRESIQYEQTCSSAPPDSPVCGQQSKPVAGEGLDPK